MRVFFFIKKNFFFLKRLNILSSSYPTFMEMEGIYHKYITSHFALFFTIAFKSVYPYSHRWEDINFYHLTTCHHLESLSKSRIIYYILYINGTQFIYCWNRVRFLFFQCYYFNVNNRSWILTLVRVIRYFNNWANYNFLIYFFYITHIRTAHASCICKNLILSLYYKN